LCAWLWLAIERAFGEGEAGAFDFCTITRAWTRLGECVEAVPSLRGGEDEDDSDEDEEGDEDRVGDGDKRDGEDVDLRARGTGRGGVKVENSDGEGERSGIEDGRGDGFEGGGVEGLIA